MKKLCSVFLLLGCLLALSACQPANPAAQAQSGADYAQFLAAYQRTQGLKDTQYDLSANYHIVLEQEGKELSSADVALSGNLKTNGAGGNNVSFSCDAGLQWSYWEEPSTQSCHYADGILSSEYYSAPDATHGEHEAECAYSTALMSITGYYEFMQFPESVILAYGPNTDPYVFSCTIPSEKVYAYLYSFTYTPLFTVISTESTKWEFGDVVLENRLNADGYLTKQIWTVTARSLVPLGDDNASEYTETVIEISVQLELIDPGGEVVLARP